ncbi:MAG: hypothetical protein LWX56_11090 [Ignavibacteria bacterium]|nr:hypothetical protein [Ignavibacteria bacterium]
MEVIAPVISMLVMGMVALTYIFFRFKERQMLINRGVEVKELKMLSNFNPGSTLLFRLGIIVIGVGVGIFFGEIAYNNTQNDTMHAVAILISLGISMILAQFFGDKILNKKKEIL